MHLAFGSIRHKVNMAFVSQGTRTAASTTILGRGAVGGCQMSAVYGNSHYTFKRELPCDMYQALYPCTCIFFPLKPFIDHGN